MLLLSKILLDRKKHCLTAIKKFTASLHLFLISQINLFMLEYKSFNQIIYYVYFVKT